MPAQYIYTHSTGSNVDLSARVRAYTTEASMNAEEGSVALSTFEVDDEEAGLDIKGHRTFQWIESSEGSNTNVIWYGYTADRDIDRGPFRVQRSRRWHVNAADVNSYLTRPIMRGADANRPAETDVARVQWLMSTSEMSGVPDTTYVAATSPVSMDANDYRDQTILSILDDCAQQSGKNYFVFYNGFTTPPKLGLFYDFAASSNYSSSVRLTNVLADVDSTTTYAVFNDDLKLNRDPSRVYSDVLLPFVGGEVYIRRASIGNEFAFRATTAPSVNVHTTATATARANRYLDDIATEEDRVICSYLVPLARVNQLVQGQRFQGKFSHLPGLSDWTWLRALKRTVKAESEEFYRVTLEATPGASVGTTGGDVLVAFINKGGPGDLNEPIDLSTNGWTKAFWTGNYANSGQFPGPGGPGSFGIWYRNVVAGESATVLTINNSGSQAESVWVYQIRGATLSGLAATSGIDTLTYSLGGPANISSGSAASSSVFIGGFMLQKVNYGQATTMNTTQGTALANVNGANDALVCGNGDPSPPKVWIGYRTGTGVLTIGGTLDCDGAGPGDYNFYGRGYGGLLLPLTGAFSVVQSAFNVKVSANLSIVLPSPP